LLRLLRWLLLLPRVNRHEPGDRQHDGERKRDFEMHLAV
jgi:hypothetical protein